MQSHVVVPGKTAITGVSGAERLLSSWTADSSTHPDWL